MCSVFLKRHSFALPLDDMMRDTLAVQDSRPPRCKNPISISYPNASMQDSSVFRSLVVLPSFRLKTTPPETHPTLGIHKPFADLLSPTPFTCPALPCNFLAAIVGFSYPHPFYKFRQPTSPVLNYPVSDQMRQRPSASFLSERGKSTTVDCLRVNPLPETDIQTTLACAIINFDVQRRHDQMWSPPPYFHRKGGSSLLTDFSAGKFRVPRAL